MQRNSRVERRFVGRSLGWGLTDESSSASNGFVRAAMRRTLPTDGIAFWKESGVAFSFFVCVNSEVF